jgi:dienelactone hydrolase
MSRAGKLSICAVAAILLMGFQVMAQEISTTLAGGETGRIHYQSTSPYDFRDMLNGRGGSSGLVVFGDLVIPKGAKGQIPAVVFVHGSGGWNSNHERYLNAFHKMGIATFRLDSFRPRKVNSTVGAQVRVTETMMMADAFNALKLLATHPKVDPNRIGIMGTSKGGGVALFTAWEPTRKVLLGSGLKFAFHLPLYPPCGIFRPLRFSGAPILILGGELDKWTPAAPCTELIEALRAKGYDAKITIYPGAHHSFDSESPLHRVERAFNITKCRFEVQPNGTTIERTTGISLDSLENRKLALSECATRGVLAGQNPEARAETMEDVKNFLGRVFGP